VFLLSIDNEVPVLAENVFSLSYKRIFIIIICILFTIVWVIHFIIIKEKFIFTMD